MCTESKLAFLQMLKEAGLDDFVHELMPYVTGVVLTTASKLQSWVVRHSETKLHVEDDICSTITEELLTYS